MNAVAIIQARMGSTRLPGKVLLDIAGESMLVRVIRRTQRAAQLDRTIVATSTEACDDAIAQICRKHDCYCFRGSDKDVLDRYFQAAREVGAGTVVRVSSDCPLIDPQVIDTVVQKYRQGAYDYVSNSLQLTYPRGMDVEVLSFPALEDAWANANERAQREHVTPFIYQHPDRFRLGCVTAAADYSHLRWTVDTEEDLQLVREIYRRLSHPFAGWREVLKLLEKEPALTAINAHIQQKNVEGR